MKTLVLLRHGKADFDRSGEDHRRKLTTRGRRNAITMGARAAALVEPGNLILTSDAARALETAEIVAEQLAATDRISVEPAIYLASTETLLEIVRRLPDTTQTVMLVGHNPGFEDLANWLLPADAAIDLLPTAGMVTLQLPVATWGAVQPASAILIDFSTPKQLRD